MRFKSNKSLTIPSSGTAIDKTEWRPERASPAFVCLWLLFLAAPLICETKTLFSN